MWMFSGLAPWISHLIIGLYIIGVVLLGGTVLARARRSPMWVFLLLIPYVSLIGVFVFAWTRWPSLEGSGLDGSGGESNRT